MANDNEFVDKRLSSLAEPAGFTPNASWARIKLGTHAPAAGRQWVWKATVAAVLLLLFGALPAARAIAQTGTLSPDTFSHSLHDMLLDVHVFIYYHVKALENWWNG